MQVQFKLSPVLSLGSLAIHLLSEIGSQFVSASKLSFFGGDNTEALRAAAATPADLAGLSLGGPGTSAEMQVKERLFILETLLFSPSGVGAEVTLEVTCRLVSSSS